MSSEPTAPTVTGGPIYVGGLDRCGKTTMSGFLSSHSRIGIPEVGSNLWTYFYRRFGNLDEKANLDQCLAAMYAYKHVRFLQPDLDRIRQEFQDGPRTYARLFSLFLAHHAERSGKARWGAQTGLIERYADELIEAYEGVRIVHMLRDPRDRYAASLERWPDGRGRAGAATARWQYSTRLAEQHAKRYPEQFRIVRFEDLIVETESTVREVCAFLGEQFEPAMLDMPAAAKHRSKLTAGADSAAESGLLSRDHIGRYQNLVPRSETAFIERHAGRRMATHGYALDEVELSLRQRVGFLVVDRPVNLARMAAWRIVEGAQQRFPERIGRSPGKRMIATEP